MISIKGGNKKAKNIKIITLIQKLFCSARMISIFSRSLKPTI